MARSAYPKGAQVLETGKFIDNDPLSPTYGLQKDPTAVFFHYRAPGGPNIQLVYGVDAAVVRDLEGQYHVAMDYDTVGDWLVKWRSTGLFKSSTPDYTVEVTPSAF